MYLSLTCLPACCWTWVKENPPQKAKWRMALSMACSAPQLRVVASNWGACLSASACSFSPMVHGWKVAHGPQTFSATTVTALRQKEDSCVKQKMIRKSNTSKLRLFLWFPLPGPPELPERNFIFFCHGSDPTQCLDDVLFKSISFGSEDSLIQETLSESFVLHEISTCCLLYGWWSQRSTKQTLLKLSSATAPVNP